MKTAKFNIQNKNYFQRLHVSFKFLNHNKIRKIQLQLNRKCKKLKIPLLNRVRMSYFKLKIKFKVSLLLDKAVPLMK